MKRIAIIGAGPGGLMLARLLQSRGIKPVVFERDAHADERPQGGSLDLHEDTGQYAVRRAGLEQEFAAAARRKIRATGSMTPMGTFSSIMTAAGITGRRSTARPCASC
jgi:2-polyprenyl-6-methoxyphenol hydroxylase-like FAD-dependent oxidoreductase